MPPPFEELQGYPLPPQASPLDGRPPLAPPNSGGDRNQIITALKMIVPAIAAIYSAKSGGGLGGFMQGFSHGEEQNNINNDRIARRQQDTDELKLRQEHERRAAADELRQQAAQEHQAAAIATAKADALKLAQQERERNEIVHAFDKATMSNPGFMKKVNEAYKSGHAYSINVPGIGPIDVKDAFAKMGGMTDPTGEMLYGDEAAPATPESLVPTAGPNGKPVYGPKVAGAPVYERPRAPKEPKPAPKQDIIIKKVKDSDDPGGPGTDHRFDRATGKDLGPLLATSGGTKSGTIRARDPQGKLHEAAAGTPLPSGWTLEP